MPANSISARRIFAAGLAGGTAEVIWVAMYTHATGGSAAHIAQQIAVTVFGADPGSVAAGVSIHFALSCAIALAFSAILLRPLQQVGGRGAVFAGSIAVLILIWAFNFFIALPQINPAFVTLLPLTATFVSKLLFGLAFGAVLCDAVPQTRSALAWTH